MVIVVLVVIKLESTVRDIMKTDELIENEIYENNDIPLKEKEILIDNWNRINKLADKRIEQLKELYGAEWWEASLKDKWYQFLCRNIVQLKIWARKIDYLEKYL